jgi:predicted DNA-binding transcriptional regulator YafY
MRRAERLFRLVSELRLRSISRAEDLAAHLEVSVRTVYRDIAHLQASGLPIEGEAGVGYLLRPGFDLPALTFTFEQLDALAIGLSFVEVAGDTSLAEAAREARAKLQAALPEPDQRKLERAPLFASRRDGRAAPVLRIVRRAVRAAKVVRLHYEGADGTSSIRRVRPLAIWAFTDGWLVAGWCELRQDFRAFRIDRILKAEETGESFTENPGQDLQSYLRSKLLVTG